MKTTTQYTPESVPDSLIAAAPELLAALENSSALMDEVASWLTGDESFSFETLAEGLAQQATKAREAIAKAKGATP